MARNLRAMSIQMLGLTFSGRLDVMKSTNIIVKNPAREINCLGLFRTA